MSPLRKALAAAALTAASVALIPGVSGAATTDAVCTLPAYDWTFNSLKQSPCLVASYASAACNDGNWNVPALKSGYYYSGPTSPASANQCRCSRPVWSLIIACDACQNGTYWATWQQWTTNCTTAGTYMNFPQDVPSDTRIPGWAFASIPSTGKWDPVAAQALASAPESSATRVVSTVSSIPPTSSTFSSTSPTFGFSTSGDTSASSVSNSVSRTGNPSSVPSNTGGVILSTSSGSNGVVVSTIFAPSPSQTGNSAGSDSGGGGGGSNAGPIAGGVVGGIVALAALAGLIWFLRRRRNNADADPVGGGAYPPPNQPPMGQAPGSVAGAGAYAPYAQGNEERPLSYYNPHDPSTYPHPQPTGTPLSGGYSDHSAVPLAQPSAFYQSASNPFQTPLATPAGPPSGYQPPFTPNRGYQGTPEVS